jgi:hypothetical protein
MTLVETFPGIFTQVPDALDDKVNWVHQPAFDKTFADLTGTTCEHEEWRREVRWNFTADDTSFTQ